jgi:DNA-binding response OmpR family regulator
MRILLVEDEKGLAEALQQILTKEGHGADAVFDGEAGLAYARTGIYDLVILDIMLPKLDGLEVLTRLRKEGLATPVILLTARGTVADRVAGLDRGADDYLPKPFATEELLARIRAASRRRGDVLPEDTLRFADLELNPQTLMLSTGVREIKLNPKEKELMELLMHRAKTVTPKELILDKLWGFDSEAVENHAEVYVSFLRKKLRHLEARVGITTIRSVGYRLEEKA